MVNSNLLSLEIGENYSLRRRAVKRILDLDLYGYQWNNSYSIKIRTLLIELKKFMNKKSILNIRGLRHYFSNYDNYLGETKNKREKKHFDERRNNKNQHLVIEQLIKYKIKDCLLLVARIRQYKKNQAQ